MTEENKSGFRFFKVVVELPYGARPTTADAQERVPPAAKMAALHTASPSGMIDMSAKRLYHTRALARIGVHAQT